MHPRVLSAKYEGNYKLWLQFTNNEIKRFDFETYLHFPVYEPLKDEAFCRKLKVSDGIVQWNDHIDFDPATVYLESKKIS